jgi:hypothetical protein
MRQRQHPLAGSVSNFSPPPPSSHMQKLRKKTRQYKKPWFLRNDCACIHRKKKVRKFPVPSRDAKLSLDGNKDVITELFLPRGSLVSDIPAGDGKLVNLFLRCRVG